MFSIDGLVSGLDTASIIEGLVSLQEAQVERLNIRKSELVQKQTAFSAIEARAVGLRSTMSQLNRSTSSVFEKSVGSSSDESIATVSTQSGAIPGSYTLRVNSLARAHQIGSQGIDSGSSLGTGTISIQVGDRSAVDITLDETNNSVNGLVSAINSASDDVSASVVFDQSSNSNRILLTSAHTGAANEIAVSSNLTASGDQTIPDFSGPDIEPASNAVLQLGSGAGAIVSEYSTNEISDLIENVTLNLVSADADKEFTVNVSQDNSQAVDAVSEFVDEFNSLIDFIDALTDYDPESGQAGLLVGNRNVANLKNNLGAIVTGTVPNENGGLNRFSQLGIEIDTKGKLTFDTVKFEDALNGEIDDVSPDDISRMFGLSGDSDRSGVEFILGSTRTQSSENGYGIDILQAAEQARVTGAQSLATDIVIDETNNQFELSLDGLTSEPITLAAGTYTQSELAKHLQSRINASDGIRGSEVQVSVVDQKIQITSQRYGRSSELSGFSGSALTALGFDGSETDQGQDVAGSFVVNGVVETATGSGRVLVGDSDNEFTADMQVRVQMDSSQIGDGVEATIDVSRGITSQLDQFFEGILDSDTGTLQNISTDFDLRIESLDDSIARVNDISEAKSAYLVEQFTALERVLSDLQSTSSFLTSQLASI